MIEISEAVSYHSHINRILSEFDCAKEPEKRMQKQIRLKIGQALPRVRQWGGEKRNKMQSLAINGLVSFDLRGETIMSGDALLAGVETASGFMASAYYTNKIHPLEGIFDRQSPEQLSKLRIIQLLKIVTTYLPSLSVLLLAGMLEDKNPQIANHLANFSKGLLLGPAVGNISSLYRSYRDREN